MSQPKKIKTAIWIGEKQWASLKAQADSKEAQRREDKGLEIVVEVMYALTK